MDLQNYLRNNNDFGYIKSLGIKIKQHSKYKNLYQFKYGRKATFDNKLVIQSRGIILDKNQNWKIISYPYDKFFNYGERKTNIFDWKNINIFEKLDGSIITLYYYNKSWNIQTNGTPDGKTPIHNKNVTFEQLFWKIFKEKKYKLPTKINYCYIFELVSPLNRIIVNYKKSDVILHGIRCLDDLKEFSVIKFDTLNWNVVRTIKLDNNINKIIKYVNNLDGKNNEGIVICDNNFRRLKIKNEEYLRIAYSYLSGNPSLKTLLKVIFEDEVSEFVTYNQNKITIINEILLVLKLIKSIINNKFHELSFIQFKSTKELAKHIENLWYKSYIFSKVKNPDTNLNNWIQKYGNNKLIHQMKLLSKMLEIYDLE